MERAINEINDLGHKPEDFQSFALPTELSSRTRKLRKIKNPVPLF